MGTVYTCKASITAYITASILKDGLSSALLGSPFIMDVIMAAY